MYRLPLLILAFMASFALGAWLRLTDLDRRVMHSDEAVNAVITGHIVEGTPFIYNPHDIHGPTLHYTTAAVARLRGITSFDEFDETLVRSVPAIFGLLLIAATFLIRKELGGTVPTLLAIWLIALAPMLVFFSRYFIMEQPFILFLFLFGVSLWRYRLTHSKAWILSAGLFLGLLHATKETFVIHIFAMTVAALIILGGKPTLSWTWWCQRPWKDWFSIAAIGLGVSSTLLTGFFRNPQALTDSFRTYFLYLQRASGSESGHQQPWHYYWTELFSLKAHDHFIHSSILILVLATLGCYVAWSQKSIGKPNQFQRIVALYTLITAAIYSLIPYKTPWSFLGCMHGFHILAALGLAWLFGLPGHRRSFDFNLKTITAFLAVGMLTLHFTLYNQRTLLTHVADPKQPFVYAHPLQSFLLLDQRLRNTELINESGPLELIAATEESGWPLQWYRRHAIGYNTYTKELPIPLDTNTPFVITDRSQFPTAAQWLQNTHTNESHDLRPGVTLHLFIRNDLRRPLPLNIHQPLPNQP